MSVFFGRYRTGVIDVWAGTAAGLYWRVRKISGGAAVGFPISTSNLVDKNKIQKKTQSTTISATNGGTSAIPNLTFNNLIIGKNYRVSLHADLIIFVNASGAGSFNFNTIALSGVAAACQGKLFTLNAYGDTSSSAVNLIAGVNTATISWSTVSANRLTTTGMSLAGAATDATTLTFTTPVATAGAIFKLTLQSQ